MNTAQIDAAFQTVRVNPADTYAAAELLEALAVASGDTRYRRAAGHLRGAHAGRPMIDDSAALTTMAHMLDCGEARDVKHASELASHGAQPGKSQQAKAWRLERKYRAENCSKQN